MSPPLSEPSFPKPNGWEAYIDIILPDPKPYELGIEALRNDIREAQKAGNKELVVLDQSGLEATEKALFYQTLRGRESVEALNDLWEKSPRFRTMIQGIYQGPLPPEAAPHKRIKLQLDIDKSERFGTQALVEPKEWSHYPEDARAQQNEILNKTVFIKTSSYATTYEPRLDNQDYHQAASGKLVIADMQSALAHEFAHVYLTQRYTENPLQDIFHPKVTKADIALHAANAEALTRMAERNIMLEVGAAYTSDACDHPRNVQDCGPLKDPNSQISRRFTELEPLLLQPHPDPKVPQLSAETLTRVEKEVKALATIMARANQDGQVTQSEAQEILKASAPLYKDLQPLIQARAQADLPASLNVGLMKELGVKDRTELNALAEKVGQRGIEDAKLDSVRQFNAVMIALGTGERNR